MCGFVSHVGFSCPICCEDVGRSRVGVSSTTGRLNHLSKLA